MCCVIRGREIYPRDTPGTESSLAIGTRELVKASARSGRVIADAMIVAVMGRAVSSPGVREKEGNEETTKGHEKGDVTGDGEERGSAERTGRSMSVEATSAVVTVPAVPDSIGGGGRH